MNGKSAAPIDADREIHIVIECTHQFSLELSREDGTPLERLSVDVDWTPAAEWAHFEAIRAGKLPAVSAMEHTTVTPVWASDKGEPYLGGVRVTVRSPDGGAASSDIPVTYFKGHAQDAATQLVQDGKLEKGDLFHFVVSGFPAPRPVSSPSERSFTVRETAEPIPFVSRSMEELKKRSVHVRDDCADAADAPVFISGRVLEDASDLAAKAFPQEAGGVLLGHLVRDPATQEIGSIITALVPAVLAEGQVTRLSFTADAWTAVRTAITLRKRNEIWCGWAHSHPSREWCKNCSPERRKVCPMTKDFFSAEDVTVHRTVFPRAYSIGLVANVTDDGIAYSLFGWRHGMIRLRSFHVIKEGQC